MLKSWRDRSLGNLLGDHGLQGVPEREFPNDGWSGARLTRLERDNRQFVLKRTSWDTDWIARATSDRELREAVVAAGALPLPREAGAAYLGAADDGSGAAILMNDLTGTLLDWSQPIGAEDLDRVLDGLALLHASVAPETFPWCPVDARLALLTRSAAERYRAAGLRVGGRFIEGWNAFDEWAPSGARDLVRRLDRDVRPLMNMLARLPAALIHGDVKLANVGFVDRGITLIDWAMTMRAPVAIELGWLLVSNVAVLPEAPEAVLERYRTAATRRGVPLGDWDAQVDLAILVGLLLRGWRKGIDARDGTPTGYGWSAAEDLEWWSSRAVEAAERRL